MQLPEISPIPHWLLELVMVAPEDWAHVSAPSNAIQRLAELNQALKNPDILYCLCMAVVQFVNTQSAISQQAFSGMHDVFTQQQIVGENRGLTYFFAQIDEVRSKLQEIAAR